MPAFDDDPGCRPCGVANLTRHCRRSGSLPQIQVCRGGVWADVFQVSIGRGGLERQKSRCGDEMMRVMLYEAAQSMLRSKKWSWLKAWAMQIARRCGMKKAIVALARRLAVIMHRMWVDGTEFRWTREQAAAAA